MRILSIILVSFLFTKSFSVNSQALETVDVTSEGNRYVGEVLNGQRHGKGTFFVDLLQSTCKSSCLSWHLEYHHILKSYQKIYARKEELINIVQPQITEE